MNKKMIPVGIRLAIFFSAFVIAIDKAPPWKDSITYIDVDGLGHIKYKRGSNE